jgi:hypothetical protein
MPWKKKQAYLSIANNLLILERREPRTTTTQKALAHQITSEDAYIQLLKGESIPAR